ncbi:MAG: sigma-70 family RNA polymerase sigma factor [Saprospiraceae bacterium]|nr:sigma-70 family RNA polymerase sigma factor [Saprospiraceae bacterium]MDW8229191.1 sigma-70 family RNA polymerase sigma factor [Saprospiraceae bacterium]
MLFLKKSYSDDQIIAQIKSGGATREAALQYLFAESGWRASAFRLIRSLGGTQHEAEDAIQEAFIVFDNHIRTDRYQQTGGLKSYFLGICRGRWYSNRRSVRRLVYSEEPIPKQRADHEEPEKWTIEKEQREQLKALVNQLDERCREILHLYKLNYSMEEIAQAFQLGTENNARQRVFQCRQKLAKLIQHNPFFNESEL